MEAKVGCRRDDQQNGRTDQDFPRRVARLHFSFYFRELGSSTEFYTNGAAQFARSLRGSFQALPSSPIRRGGSDTMRTI